MEQADWQPQPHNGAQPDSLLPTFEATARSASVLTHLREPTGPLGRYWAVVLYGWLTVAISVAPGPVWLRVLVVFSFVVVGPGIPTIGILRHREPLEHLVLAVVASMSVATLLAEGMALLGWWSAIGCLALLAGITTVAAVLQGSEERATQALAENELSDANMWNGHDRSADP